MHLGHEHSFLNFSTIIHFRRHPSIGRRRRSRGKQEYDPAIESQPDIRLVSVRSGNMPPSPFRVTLYVAGLNSKPIEVDRAFENDTISVHLIRASVAKKFGVTPEPYSTTIGNYTIVGRLYPDWRRKEREDQNWSTRHEVWLVTTSPLPDNAQALIRPSSSSTSYGGVAPVHGPRRTAQEKADAAVRDQQVKIRNAQQAEALRQSLEKKYNDEKDKKSRPKKS